MQKVEFLGAGCIGDLLILTVLAWSTSFGDAQTTGGGAANASIVDDRTVDFGVVPRGAKRFHVFTMTNDSDRVLRIASVRIPCSCVSATVSKKELLPNETASVIAELDTRRYSGPVSKVFYVGIEGPKNEELRFSVKAFSHDGLSMEPNTISFGLVKQGQAAEAAGTLTITDRRLFGAWSAATESDWVVCRLEPISVRGSVASYRVTASVRPGVPNGEWYSSIRLATTGTDATMLSIPITIRVEP